MTATKSQSTSTSDWRRYAAAAIESASVASRSGPVERRTVRTAARTAATATPASSRKPTIPTSLSACRNRLWGCVTVIGFERSSTFTSLKLFAPLPFAGASSKERQASSHHVQRWFELSEPSRPACAEGTSLELEKSCQRASTHDSGPPARTTETIRTAHAPTASRPAVAHTALRRTRADARPLVSSRYVAAPTPAPAASTTGAKIIPSSTRTAYGSPSEVMPGLRKAQRRTGAAAAPASASTASVSKAAPLRRTQASAARTVITIPLRE